MLYLLIFMFIISVVISVQFIYGHVAMWGGIIYTGVLLPMLLAYQLIVTESVFSVNPPTHYVYQSVIDERRTVHAKVTFEVFFTFSLANFLSLRTRPISRPDCNAGRHS
jgi:hypothetical protein